MSTSTVSAKGWVVIPQELRERYGLKKGDKVHLVDLGGVVAIVPMARNPIAAGRGLLKSNYSLSEELLEDRRRELESEERDLPSPSSAR